jgi:hypothetical protein
MGAERLGFHKISIFRRAAEPPERLSRIKFLKHDVFSVGFNEYVRQFALLSPAELSRRT